MEVADGVYGKELFHAGKRIAQHARHMLHFIKWPVLMTNRVLLGVAGFWWGGTDGYIRSTLVTASAGENPGSERSYFQANSPQSRDGKQSALAPRTELSIGAHAHPWDPLQDLCSGGREWSGRSWGLRGMVHPSSGSVVRKMFETIARWFACAHLLRIRFLSPEAGLEASSPS